MYFQLEPTIVMTKLGKIGVMVLSVCLGCCILCCNEEKTTLDTIPEPEVVVPPNEIGAAPLLGLFEVHGTTSNVKEFQLSYTPTFDGIRPRLAEVFVVYSNNLTFLNLKKGHSVENANKELVVQEVEPGKLRLVILSSNNTNTLVSGTLAELQFTKTDTAPAQIDILKEMPIFAPAEANEGLMISDAITI